ncbi:MAG: hypothetical protein AAF617_11330 [Bacteroidota bacterium]
MKSYITFLKNSWTLRAVLCVTILYTLATFIVEGTFSISDVFITLFCALYVVWGFMTPPKKSQ